LSKRPMKRIAYPLQEMGANINLHEGEYAPLLVKGNKLRGIEYELPHASAQLKSAILLAGLKAEGKTTLTGKISGRNHTENMIRDFGGDITCNIEKIELPGHQTLEGQEVNVPGDPSSASFWGAAAAILTGSTISIENISLNETRVGFLKVLEKMGAKVSKIFTKDSGEKIGNIEISTGNLHGLKIEKNEIPDLIDEIPIFAICCVYASGESSVSGAQELRIKETDRISAICTNLNSLGVDVTEFEDGFKIQGGQLDGGRVDSFGDHRIAMAFAIGALAAKKPIEIINAECVDISYPTFFEELSKYTTIEKF
ncbi:3-phosphoshikimate 1-carboxyvinyltransferase, partial [Bacteriovoracaceae bacterium]|nr:3-phosphoshikimate 1-carboxyvinyltransferase [Bacteriovoracaceae bacterium]